MKRLKAFFLICLMLAVPLQAMAGKLMLCESFHASVLPALHHVGTHDASLGVPEGHGLHSLHSQMMQTEHGHEPADHHVMQTDASVHVAGLSVFDASSDTQLSSCSVCASCATAAFGMVVNEYRVSDSAPPSSPISYSAFHIPVVDLELPDDPPRA